MHTKDSSNSIFKLALDLVAHTSQHIFLTGKAGTGKTTFLREVKAFTKKNTVVVAPTGVAAINAGGVTMHSFFQLPFGVFIPGMVPREGMSEYVAITDRHSLFKNIRFNAEKRTLLEELELLIIDEVSMMRCDMLDAIDIILRHFRKTPHIPFGGVQVVYIGDLFQLPPVVNGDDWSLLGQFYESPFFFSAKAVAEMPPIYVELKKIYRQTDQEFIDVLNRVRNNKVTNDDFDLLNQRFDPGFVPEGNDQYITVTTHNKKADAINQAELEKLPGKLFSFKADIQNDFSDKSMPTDPELRLKVGAQIMFIKNDSGTERRFFNGKLAHIRSIANGEIRVGFHDGEADLVLEKETWKNIRYTYNKEKDKIDEEELGSFTQYPVRLAWAITVHKSQGLTFERAVIDAGASFTAGQVYVALSRCTCMEGLVLRSRLHASAISTDARVVAYAQREAREDSLELVLEQEKYKTWSQALVRMFDWSKLTGMIQTWMQEIPDKKLPDIQTALKLAEAILEKAKSCSETAEKFRLQLERLTAAAMSSGDTTLLEERMARAIAYFAPLLAEDILAPVQNHLKELAYNTKVKKYKEELFVLEGFIWQQLQKLLTASYGSVQFCNDPGVYQRYNPAEATAVKKTGKGKAEKGASLHLTLELFKQGKTAQEIAMIRGLALSTIEGHLAQFVREGKLEISELVSTEKREPIEEAIKELGLSSIGVLKTHLGEGYSFGEIRAVINHQIFLQKETAWIVVD